MHRYIKAVGAGSKRARDLDRDEARCAMALVLAGAEPVQVGAFLLALRMKGESAAELAGFVDELTRHVMHASTPLPTGVLEVDAHGDGRGASLLPAAACAAAALGVPVCLSVERGSRYARHGLDATLDALGLDGELAPERAARDLARAGVAACALDAACPPLARLVALRPLLGVRTAMQTVAKLVTCFPTTETTTARAIGVFHAPYLEPTARALGEIGGRGLVVQALGGLPDARPGKVVRVADAGGASRTIDLRELHAPAASAPAPDDDAQVDGAARNRGALDATDEDAVSRASATAGLLLHAATGAGPLDAARFAEAALRDGRARAVARRLGLP